ncbi:MAG: YciI family protein [Acidimicrobiales bacterium]
MAEYLILLYADEEAMLAMGEEATNALLAEHERFVTKHAEVLRGGNRLRPSDTATSIRRDTGGGFTVTDAPFAETKEVLGGYYLIDVANLDEALAVAKAIPAPSGGVEVRPVWPTSTPSEPG